MAVCVERLEGRGGQVNFIGVAAVRQPQCALPEAIGEAPGAHGWEQILSGDPGKEPRVRILRAAWKGMANVTGGFWIPFW